MGQRLTNIRKVISIGQEWLLGRTERVAAGGPLGGYSPGYIAGLPEWHWVEPTLRRPQRKEKIALEALAEAMDKAKNLWRMQAVLSHTIDDLYAVGGGAHAGGGGTRRLLARGPPEGRLQRRVSASGDTRGLAALRERGKDALVLLPGVGAVVARQRLQPGGRSNNGGDIESKGGTISVGAQVWQSFVRSEDELSGFTFTVTALQAYRLFSVCDEEK